jgi:zinc transport system substrate-binding protein
MINKILISLTVWGAAFIGFGLISCGGGNAIRNDNTLVVSIEPLQFIVEAIVGDDFAVAVLVPPGASPETWEPTPQKMRTTENAPLVFSTGLIGFEAVILDHLPSPERFVNLSAGIELVGTAGHACDAGHAYDSTQAHDSVSAKGGFDPHIWMAPRALSKMARTAYERIHEKWPDSTSYTANYRQLAERLTALDHEVSSRLAATHNRSFMVFHPSLTYYAHDYGLRQIALEIDGKEPSVKQLGDIVTLARKERISQILYQREFPRRTVEVVADEIGATPVEIDILGGNVMGNILYITDIIAGNKAARQE